MHCTECNGGCGAEITADTEAEVIAKWNRRAAALSCAPTGVMMIEEGGCPACVTCGQPWPTVSPAASAQPVAEDVICNLRTAWLELGLMLVESDARSEAVATKAREAIYAAIQTLEARPPVPADVGLTAEEIIALNSNPPWGNYVQGAPSEILKFADALIAAVRDKGVRNG